MMFGFPMLSLSSMLREQRSQRRMLESELRLGLLEIHGNWFVSKVGKPYESDHFVVWRLTPKCRHLCVEWITSYRDRARRLAVRMCRDEQGATS